jgi:transcription elongation factor GreA
MSGNSLETQWAYQRCEVAFAPRPLAVGRQAFPTFSIHKSFIMGEGMEDLKKKLQEEIATLEHELRTELPREISRARALGDLSENAEYHAAKERQRLVDARLSQLNMRLRELSMIDMTRIPRDRVGLGSQVVVLDVNKDEEITYNLVTSEEADANAGKISTSSPIGKGLLGKQVGDTVKIQIPGGMKELEVVSLLTIHDMAASS